MTDAAGLMLDEFVKAADGVEAEFLGAHAKPAITAPRGRRRGVTRFPAGRLHVYGNGRPADRDDPGDPCQTPCHAAPC
ncbi:hypothetical protein MPPM_2691 [Methylorubrum populi]|uniref:Uncharacterized protein n=1 Tax=Methylorubrum populi TaxID=223967 RepID=A0A160PF89_9HYPH|nr:hypothetical protein MPPM_2691 [Methylorubrum populi]